MYLYPLLDSVVWSKASVPAVTRVLAFEPEAGSIAFVDGKNQPSRIDLRLSESRTASKTKLTSLSSANGADIYGVNAAGSVLRMNPSGADWKLDLPSPARAVFAQPNGNLIIAANRGESTVLWRVRPPDKEILDSAVLPLTGRAVRTQVGDRLYFTADSGLVGVKAADLSPVASMSFKSRVRSLATTPSGDRLYVTTATEPEIAVVDRYSGLIETRIPTPAAPSDLRMDPLGRYLLARFPRADSAWVIAIGTNRLVGAVATRWAQDLPGITPDGLLALLGERDVRFVRAATLKADRTVKNGARDFWYFFSWDGFRPRAQGLDQPVTFGGDSIPMDSTAASSTPPGIDSAGGAAVPPPSAVPQRAAGFTVSFAAILNEPQARAVASSITVNGARARVVTTNAGGSPVYRVVLGPFNSRLEAENVGRASGRQYWIYEESR